MWPPIFGKKEKFLNTAHKQFHQKESESRIRPRFWDVYKSEVFKERKGIHSNQRGPGKNPSVLSVRGNTELKSVQPWPIVPLRKESNTQWTTDCVSLALFKDIPLENADQRTNVVRMAVLKCTIQFSMQPPPLVPTKSRMELHLFWITEALCQWYT